MASQHSSHLKRGVYSFKVYRLKHMIADLQAAKTTEKANSDKIVTVDEEVSNSNNILGSEESRSHVWNNAAQQLATLCSFVNPKHDVFSFIGRRMRTQYSCLYVTHFNRWDRQQAHYHFFFLSFLYLTWSSDGCCRLHSGRRYLSVRTCDGNEMNYSLTNSGYLPNRDVVAASDTIF